jgi:PPOX class probable F420-dependent enzyme
MNNTPVLSLKTAIPESHLSILETATMAMLSTIRHKDGHISTTPMGFDWDGETLRFSTLKERVKYRNMQNDPRIAVCIVDPKNITRYVEIRGVAELQDDPDGSLNKRMYKRQTGKEFDLDEPGAQRVIVTVIPHQVSTPLLYGGRVERQGAQAAAR